MEYLQHSEASTWHLLQISGVLDFEFASSLATLVPLVAWEPRRTVRAMIIRVGDEEERLAPNTSLRIRGLPVLPGFNRLPVALSGALGPATVDRLLYCTPQPVLAPLICTVPYFAPVAEAWPGPVIYWLTDLMAEYAGANRAQVIELDRRICRVATLVCPNSERLKDYLVDSVGCDPALITVVPNATRAANVPASSPGVRPTDHSALTGIPRPIAGVIGNLAANTDWILLQKMMSLVPEFSWVFIGPTTMQIDDKQQRRARLELIQHPSAHFLGGRPYAELVSFARAFDVAVLPYRRCEPTYSGSSTRFYDHLAACRPMIATRGTEELLRKPPLLEIVDTAEGAAAALRRLASRNFDDGLADLRWRTSRENTWDDRALAVERALTRRLAQRPLAS